MTKKSKRQRNDHKKNPAAAAEAEDQIKQGVPREPDESAVTEPTADAQLELAELKQRMQRLAADYQNYQKRSLRQIEQASQLAKENLIKSLLTVLDNFEHTLEKGREQTEISALLQGVQIVYDHMVNVLEGAGMRRIEVKAGDYFDPNLHEAMLHEESEQYPENRILRELVTGYAMNDRTLRPVRVSVAKAPVADEPEEMESAEPGLEKSEGAQE